MQAGLAQWNTDLLDRLWGVAIAPGMSVEATRCHYRCASGGAVFVALLTTIIQLPGMGKMPGRGLSGIQANWQLHLFEQVS